MPLSALIDGELVCAPLLDEQRWQELKGREFSLQPCGHRGFGRVSPQGTQHFVHERDSGCEHSESSEHLHLKTVVAQAVAAAGWQAGTEVVGNGFIADVLATRGDQRVAFEVQRSKQVLRDYRHRQQRYRDEGIRCVWFARAAPAGYVVGPDLPLFVVDGWDGRPTAVLVGRTLPVAEVVGSLLDGRVRWTSEIACQRQTHDILRLLCPVCGQSREVVVSRWLHGTCVCGLPVTRQQPNSAWWEKSKCCGYWGPALTLGRTSRSHPSTSRMELGHWCVREQPMDQRVSA